MEKSQIFDENHGLNPLENCNFLTLLFLLSRKTVFRWRIQ